MSVRKQIKQLIEDIELVGSVDRSVVIGDTVYLSENANSWFGAITAASTLPCDPREAAGCSGAQNCRHRTGGEIFPELPAVPHIWDSPALDSANCAPAPAAPRPGRLHLH